MKKKGFTLIELLAVIVILAVIAIIATPLIMNVINDARKSSFKDSAYGITKAIELKSMRERLNDTGNSTFVVDLTGTDLDYKGSKPKAGYAAINVSGDIALEMNDGTWCVTKGFTDTDVTITKLEEGCDGSSIQSLDLTIPTSNNQAQGLFTGTIYSMSDAEVGDSISGKWCIVGTIEGELYNSCDDDDFSFPTETKCQGCIQEGIDMGKTQEGEVTCQKASVSFTYQKNASALNSDYYFKYDVNNGIIEAYHLCYMTDKEYCFDGMGSYSDHVQVLQSLEPWFEANGGFCTKGSSSNYLLNIPFAFNTLHLNDLAVTFSDNYYSCTLNNSTLKINVVESQGVSITMTDPNSCNDIVVEEGNVCENTTEKLIISDFGPSKQFSPAHESTRVK